MVKKIMIIVITFALFISFPCEAYAEEEIIPDEYEDFYDSLPDDIKELLPKELLADSFDEIGQAAEKMTSWEYIWDLIFEILGFNLKKSFKALLSLVATLILSSILNAIFKTLRNNSIARALKLISGMIIVLVVMELTHEPLEDAVLLLDRIKLYINTSSPVLVAMLAMGGNASSALVQNYGMIVFLTVFENVCILALEMILGVCTSLTLASSFIPDGGLISISSVIKKAFTFFVGFIMLIFTTVISTQNILSSKADTLSAKAAKMLATQIIPVVGGTIGDTLRTAGASIEYLRSSVGVVLVAVLLLIVMPTIISIFLYRTSFIISNALAGLLGCDREGTLLMEMSSIYGYVLAILSISSVVLLFLITLFAKSASPLS